LARGFLGGDSDGSDLTSFFSTLGTLGTSQFQISEKFKPELRFIRFLFDDGKLRNEVGTRLRVTRGSIIGSY